MHAFVVSLKKRKRVTQYIIILFVCLALAVDYFFSVEALTYFDGKYNFYFAYGLIIYKFIELFIVYYILFHRYILKLKRNIFDEKDFPKLKKHTTLLLFLIPQGNTIFGIIAYKLTGDVSYFILFCIIALVTLVLVKPEKLLTSKYTQT